MYKRLATIMLLCSGLFLAGCTDTLDVGRHAEAPLPARLVQAMKAKGMTRHSPIMVRIFKEEGKLEVWKRKDTGRFDVIADYEICKWSGKLGPKYMEGDRQAPEGFYTIRPYQMNPRSKYHLSFNIGFPNQYDRVHGRSGRHLMVHGACSSAGCYSMTDAQVSEIYAFARDAFRGGQTEFQVQAFPFRMTPQNMARYANDPNFAFWKMLKEGYDHFELTKVPPKVDVCERRYVFNQIAEEGHEFKPAGICPPMNQPESLRLAYQALSQEPLMSYAVASSPETPLNLSPSIQGRKEARLVSAWSKRRARGERVSRKPPSLGGPPANAPAPAARPVTQVTATAPEPRAEPEATGSAAPVPEPNPKSVAETQDGKKKKWWNLFGD